MKNAVTFLAAIAVVTSSHALEIKGIEIDKPTDCSHVGDISNYDSWQACKGDAPNFVVHTSFLDRKVNILVTRADQKVVTSLYLEGFDFAMAESAFTEKYGRPKATNSVLQNAMGAKFQQRELLWENGNAVLIVRRHGPKVGTATAQLISKQGLAELQRKRESQKSDI